MTRLVAFTKALALASVLLVAPVVYAGPVDNSDSAPVVGWSWLDSALDGVGRWFVGILGVDRPSQSLETAVGNDGTGGDETWSTGSCIDPMGFPVPCNDPQG
jgi:hypothetical protein